MSHPNRLEALHTGLLRLHKALLDDEHREYERTNGKVASSGQLLNLVMHDPWFDWLHRISENIVAIDEALDQEKKKTKTPEEVDARLGEILARLKRLFRPEGDKTTQESDFMSRYKATLRRDPGAVIAHFEVQRLLSEAVVSSPAE